MSSMLQSVAQPSAAPATGTQLYGHAAVFNEWARIQTRTGPFLERIAPGAFSRTLAERGSRVRALLEHGHDARVGNRPLGVVVDLREDARGLSYAVDLFDDEPYVAELKSALRAGLYGASFRFRVAAEDTEVRPGRSAYNPTGIPETTLRDVDLVEVGPCVFGAYEGATSGLRSAGDRRFSVVRETAVEVTPTAPVRRRNLVPLYCGTNRGRTPTWRL